MSEKPKIVPTATVSATERTYRDVLSWIENRELVPGDVLDERRLSEALSVSRTPLRSALSRLLGEGYLVRLANGAMVVREIGVGEVLELLYIRRLLEPEAAMLAVERIPQQRLHNLKEELSNPHVMDQGGPESWRKGDDVHDLITEFCSNRSLADVLEQARKRIRVSNIERVPGRGDHADDEHLSIVQAMIDRNREAVHTSVLKHLDNIRDGFLAAFGVGVQHDR
ncbi:GntR family transcriptional regulator [Paenalcaligenes sp. Me52]|uniref:GntR family transcriptional regulator n=1 Tax=Paenalcaligenes sp. Me52 TaxID=3392038 RepID=UPI003D272BCB